MSIQTPTSAADATIVGASFLNGYDKASKVPGYVSWRAGVELAGRGSTLDIPVIGRAAITDYNPNAPFTFSEIEDDNVAVVLDQAKSWGKKINRIKEAHGAGSYLGQVAQGAGSDMAYEIDKFVLGVAAAGAGVTVPVLDLSVDGAAFNFITDLMVALADTGNGLTVMVPTTYIAAALRDTRFVAAGQAEGHNGRVLSAIGATIVETNAHDSKIVAWSDQGAIVGGVSLNEVNTTFMVDPFTRTASGLCVFGASVIRPEAVAVATIA